MASVQNHCSSISHERRTHHVKVDTYSKTQRVVMRVLASVSALLAVGLFSASYLVIGGVCAITSAVLLLIARSKTTKYISVKLTSPRTASTSIAYSDFKREAKHERALEIMITNIGANDILKIRQNETLVRDQGRILKSTHPLKQLSYILSKKDLREKLKIIFSYSFPYPTLVVKKKYIKGISKALQEWHEKGQVIGYLKDFVKEIYKDKDVSEQKKLVRDLENSVSSETSNPLAKWGGFLDLLVKNI